jgi:cell division protein FtsQ
MLESLGFPAGTGRRLTRWLLTLGTIAVAVVLVFAFRVPQMAGIAIAEGVGRAGFTMRRVEINGARRVPRLAVYNIAFDQPGMAMPLVDLAATRQRLLRFGWIKDARVSRRLPDTLVVDIVERVPTAIWQHDGQLSLVDAEGAILERVRVESMPDLPLVVGPAANRHLGALDALLAAAPHLKPQVTGAAWVGDRRWDVRFRTGETLSLPEGDEAASRAIRRFAAMDAQTQLLGRGLVRFDMRIPGRVVVRVSREPGSSVPALTDPDPGEMPQDLSRTI